MIDNKTPNLLLPLPDAANTLAEDVVRLITAFGLIDTAVAARPTTTAMNAAIASAVANIVNSAPGALDTLKELASALGNDANFASTVTNALAGKLSLSGGTMTGVITFATAQRVAASIVTGLAAVATSGAYADLSGRPTLPAGAIVGTTDAQTLTNKRVNPRITSNATVVSPLALNSDGIDQYALTGLANALTVSADAGSPVDGQKFVLRLKDNGTPRIVTFTGGTAKGFRPVGVSLTASGANWAYTTVAGKTAYLGMVYNATDSRWDILAISQEA